MSRSLPLKSKPLALLPRRLYAQIVVTVSVILVAAFLSFGFMNADKQAAILERIIRNESEAITRNIADSCAHYLVVRDYAGLEELLVRFSEMPDMVNLQALEPDGTVLSDVNGRSHRPENPPKKKIPVPPGEAPQTELQGENLVIWHPILANRSLGWVRIAFSLHELTEFKSSVWRTTFLLAVLGIAASTGLILLVMRRPARSIQLLSRFAGELNLKKGTVMQVPDSSSEVEELGDSLNRASLELHASEQALLAERERLAVTLESIGDGVIATDTSGKIVLLNRTAEQLTGWSMKEAAGKPLEDVFRIISETTRRPVENPVQRVMSSRQVVGLANHTALIARDGTERSIADSGAPIIDREGTVIGVVLAFRDVTEKKRTEEFIRNIFESIGEGLIVIDRQYRIMTANRAYAEQVRRPLDLIIGSTCHEISHNRDKPCHEEKDSCCPAIHTFETGEPAVMVHDHSKAGKHMAFVETRTFPIRDGAGTVVSVIETTTDITERRKLEDQLRQAQKMEAIGQLAGGVAHDFNNILTAITGYGNLLVRKTNAGDTLRHYAEQILTSAERAARLTGSLLAFSRKQVFEMKPVDLNDIVKGVDKLLRRLIGEDIELRTIVTGANLIIMADSGQIEQVLMNLVTNARDAMPSGGTLTIETGELEVDESWRREHGFERVGAYTLLAVSDTGTGMDEDTRSRIFDPFFTTKEIGRGTGLGLAIAYGIVKQHGGVINVYSEPGKGTTFRIYFPASTGFKELPMAAEARQPAPGGTETVLLAEDEELVRKLIRLVLEGAGYRVIEAKDGEEAIVLFRENREAVKLVITDVIMPRRNGKEVYDAVRSLQPEVKALFMSGYTADIIQNRGIIEQGMNYLAKPILPDTLLRKVRSVLDG